MNIVKVDVTRREALQGLAGVAASSLLTVNGVAEKGGAAVDWKWDAAKAAERDQQFCDGWRFHRGDAAGAEAGAFDDSSWRTLDVPHDWSIEDLPDAEAYGDSAIWSQGTNPLRVGPFDVYKSEGQGATGWTVGGVGWYRKTFARPKIEAGGKAEIRFDGVYMNADVWLNGEHLGNHPYGYTAFALDLTPHLKDGSNTLAVRVNNAGRNSRWYSGSGIFRKVWLNVTGPVRIPEHGIYVTTPVVSSGSAQVKVEVTVENASSSAQTASVRVRLMDAAGTEVAQERANAKLAASGNTVVSPILTVKNPHLWSPADPHLYRVEVLVETGRNAADAVSVPIGIRKVEIDAAQGLRINGESLKLHGGCVHHDNGPLGSACIPRAEERRVEVLKANGYNAIRTSHNPPSREFLDACDRLGMVVIDEAFDCWTKGKNPDDYNVYFKQWWQRDVESMVLRDRNHPSVILWSIGNEIPERAQPDGVEIGKQLAALVHKLDGTRPVTAAICGPWEHPKQTWKDMQPAFTYLDVGGYNYQLAQYAPDHAEYPQRVMVGTESFPNEAYQNWKAIDSSPWVIGDFVWTAIDYIGESGIGNATIAAQGAPAAPFSLPYPWFNSYCGDIDLIGNKKPQSYFRDVVWGRSKIEIAVERPVPERFKEHISLWGWPDELRSWTWPGLDGTKIKVRVYTPGDEVRLFLSGNQVGQTQLTEKNALKAEFEVAYAPGELKAVAFKQGSEIGTQTLSTVGEKAKLVLKVDRAELRSGRDDLAYVMVQVVDEAGRVHPDAVAPISFSISGAGELAAVGNANPKDVASFKQAARRTFHGMCVAIVRPRGGAGEITLKAESPGLAAASTTLTVR